MWKTFQKEVELFAEIIGKHIPRKTQTVKKDGFFKKAQNKYMNALQKAPLTTTCLSVGTTYCLGEIIAQTIMLPEKKDLKWNGFKEFKEIILEKSSDVNFNPLLKVKSMAKENIRTIREKMDDYHVDRMAIYFGYGVILGGPIYFWWFRYLDKLPGRVLMMKGHIFERYNKRMFSYLKKNFTFYVGGRPIIYDDIQMSFVKKNEMYKYTIKATKLLADQLVFSVLYPLFFMTVMGYLTGEDWKKISKKIKEKFWTIYMTDLVVWPPLQIINFSLVPLHLQPIFVNVLNIFWNAFLCYQMGDSH